MIEDQSVALPKADSPWYGWVIVVVAAVAMVATLPGRTHGLGMITERLLADGRFGMNRVSYGEINLYATLLGGLFCLPCGWLIDRFGLRLVLIGSLVGLTLAVFGMCACRSSRELTFVILLTRGFGQSALSVVSITMVGKWFPGRLSLPMAVYSLILSLGFALSAQLAKPWAESDWRVVWSGIGWALVGFIPLAALLTRDPSTATVKRDQAGGECCGGTDTARMEPGFTLAQAASTQAFWVFGLAISLIALQGSGLSLFNESVLKEQGFDSSVFYDLITIGGIAGLLMKLPVGWLGTRVPLNRLLAGGLLLQALCLFLLPHIRSIAAIKAYGIGMGVSGTITTVLFFTIWGQSFGRRHLGRIQGVTQMMTVLASAAGPLLFAKMFESDGNYYRIFWYLTAITVCLAVWSLWIRMPRPEDVAVNSTTATPLPASPLLKG